MSDSEELNVCKKTWARSMDGIQKDGFREGFEAGRDENLQNGFDIGFKTGYESCFQQVLEATRKQILESSDVPYQFPEDDCVICSHKSFDDFMDLPFNTIVEKQKHLMKDSRLSLREK